MSSPVEYFGAPLPSARTAVILLHGRTQAPADMFEQVVRRIDLGEVAYCAPAAADRTWYPAGFMAPREENEPALTFALERVALLSAELETRGFAIERQVIMGFSQGGCLACEYVYRRGTRRAALIAFTGGLIGPPGIEVEWRASGASYGGMPVLLGGSDHDPWVPASRMKETAEVFRRLGAVVDLSFRPSDAHEIDADQIIRAREILTRL